MNEVRSATPGIVPRIRSSNFKNASPFDPRFIAPTRCGSHVAAACPYIYEPRVRSQRVEQALRHAVRIRIQESHHANSSFLQAAKAISPAVAQSQIFAVRVVSCPINVTSRRQPRPNSELPLRPTQTAGCEIYRAVAEYAEAARVIAPFRNLDVGGMLRRRHNSRRQIVV